MVRVYKPEFVAHDGRAPMFSVDCAPDGERFATAGGDQKVKVWALAPVLDRELEAEESTPKCLATLSDHFGPVNCVRFSKSGRFLASGSTDTNVLVYALSDGPGKSAFGSSDAPNVENWSITGKYRGHSSDVIDIAWSPDDSMLASCSLDNLVIIWDCRSGALITTLRGHTSFVKGVAWDPIGKFLATQSDDKTCIIWRTDDWTQVAKVKDPYKASMGATFSMRLCRSPDGKAVTTCNSYKKPSHTASVLERGTWDSNFDFVGHKGPVVAVRFSPVLFTDEKKDRVHTVIACGSQDCKLTIWTTNRPKPVCIVRKCFAQSVVDLCWTPDGYTLLACSTDGTLCSFKFEESEIGEKLDTAAAESFLSETYGDIRKNRAPILEDPTLLGFEGPKDLDVMSMNVKTTPPAPKRIQPVQQAPIRSTNAPQSSATTILAQRETVSNDGRRRIVPVAAAGPSAGAPVTIQRVQLKPLPTNPQPIGADAGLKRRIEPTAVNGGTGFESQLDAPVAKRLTLTPTQLPARAAQSAPSETPQRQQQVASTVQAAPQSQSLPAAPPPGAIHVQLIPPNLEADEDSEERMPLLLEAKNSDRGVELVCSRGGKTKWTDRAELRVTHVSGNKHFAAVAFEDGSLQLYSPSGRRSMPSLLLPNRVAFLVSGQDDYTLLIVTTNMFLLVWNVTPGKESCTLRENIMVLMHNSGRSGAALSNVRLSNCGVPIASFTNGHAYVFHKDLQAWARLADHSFLKSEFTSRLRQPGPSGSVGEVQALQISAARAATHMGPAALLQTSGQLPKRETGRHLEVLVSGASILKSEVEYKSWLVAYVRHLTSECGDDPRTMFVGAEAQLRELCDEFIGPLSLSATNATWQSEVLGMSKRKLLRELIIPTIAADRSAQRLVTEVFELLEAAEKRKTSPIEVDMNK